jgi:flavin reductase (DIM6/NTAB) family NADH-FMN oxidoreductase RutF
MNTIITREAIEKMHHLYRINLINSITGYKSANLIGTKDKEGVTNVAIFSSVTHFGSNPPLIGMVLRPTTVPRNTYANIKETGIYTINHVNQSIIKEAHHTSAKYEAGISEFDKTSLEEEYINEFDAPYVKQAVVKMGMELVEEIPIKANGTILILGKIRELILPEQLVTKDGFVDLNGAETVTVSGLDAYHLPKQLARMNYARPDQSPTEIIVK